MCTRSDKIGAPDWFASRSPELLSLVFVHRLGSRPTLLDQAVHFNMHFGKASTRAINRYRREVNGTIAFWTSSRDTPLSWETSFQSSNISVWGWLDAFRVLPGGGERPLRLFPILSACSPRSRPAAAARADTVGEDHAFKKETNKTRRALFRPIAPAWRSRANRLPAAGGKRRRAPMIDLHYWPTPNGHKDHAIL